MLHSRVHAMAAVYGVDVFIFLGNSVMLVVVPAVGAYLFGFVNVNGHGGLLK